MKIIERAEFRLKEKPLKKGEDEAVRAPGIVEIEGVRFFSVTPKDARDRDRINAALDEARLLGADERNRNLQAVCERIANECPNTPWGWAAKRALSS